MRLVIPYYVKRRVRGWWLYFVLIGIAFAGYYRVIDFGAHFPTSSSEQLETSRETMKEIFALKRQVHMLTSVLKQNAVPEKEYSDALLPTIYVITPTYTRPHQKAELTRLKTLFLHIPSLHWVVIEDAPKKSHLVSNFLQSSGLAYTHLNQQTPKEWKLKATDPTWFKPRGVLQRNAGIQWLRNHFKYETKPRGVVYFADDDNTYSLELFNEMRHTRRVSVWPVALVGGVMVERPQVTGGHVTAWLTGWKPDRPFAMDMAGFAVNLALLLSKPHAKFSMYSPRGFQESIFLEKLVTMEQLEPRADMCTKVYVWHTRSETPILKDEEALRKLGKPTDVGIEV